MPVSVFDASHLPTVSGFRLKKRTEAIRKPKKTAAVWASRLNPQKNENGTGAHMEKRVPHTLPSQIRTFGRNRRKTPSASHIPNACQKTNQIKPTIEENRPILVSWMMYDHIIINNPIFAIMGSV